MPIWLQNGPKSCEAKTTEVGGQPNFKRSKERKKECLEPTRNALMQTVVMSSARGLYLGKAELPTDHVHVHFFFFTSADAMQAGCPDPLKEKETPDDDGEGNTKPKANQKTLTQQPTNNKKTARGPGVFPLCGSEIGKKTWLHTVYGLNSQNKTVRRGQRRSRV